LAGKKKIFRSMGVSETAPVETFQSLWEVVSLENFNDLPHAKLAHKESGQIRSISLDALERQEIYKKARS
jgi:hypothetical protein